MRQTAKRRAYRRSGGECLRHGFTLIELVIAFGILLIVMTAMLASYGTYYSWTMRNRIRTVGQNLAQLQLEDALSMPKNVLYQLTSGDVAYSDVNYVDPSRTPQLVDVDPSSSVYDSGAANPVDGTFYIEGIKSVDVSSLGYSDHAPSSPADIPELGLPPGIVDLKVTGTDPSDYSYLLVLNKEVFPGYTRRVVITDTTPAQTQTQQKIFRVDVTVYWTIGGVTQHYTVTAEK